MYYKACICHGSVILLCSLQIDKELGEDIYFYKEKDGKWVLSIYKPLRWGIAGTAQIAEDVVCKKILSS